MVLGIFNSMISDGRDHKTAAYNTIVLCLCKYQMVEKGIELKNEMALKGCAPDSLTFLFLLHGICEEGRSNEWRSILSSNFPRNELEIAFKYAKLLDVYLNQGMSSEASLIVQSLLDQGMLLDISAS